METLVYEELAGGLYWHKAGLEVALVLELETLSHLHKLAVLIIDTILNGVDDALRIVN